MNERERQFSYLTYFTSFLKRKKERKKKERKPIQFNLPSIRTFVFVKRLPSKTDVVGSDPISVVPHQDRLQLLLLHVQVSGLVNQLLKPIKRILTENTVFL
jgi:hypothetical protein